MSIWVPFANLSYSIYLWHMLVIISLTTGSFGFSIKARDLITTTKDPSLYCDLSVKNAISTQWILFLVGLLFSIVLGALSYILIERPCIEARVAFKNKFR